MTAAELDAIGFALTDAGAKALRQQKQTRAAALCWLRTVARTAPFGVQALAQQVLAALLYAQPLGLEARQWLTRQTRIGDANHRRWAELLLGDLEE